MPNYGDYYEGYRAMHDALESGDQDTIEAVERQYGGRSDQWMQGSLDAELSA